MDSLNLNQEPVRRSSPYIGPAFPKVLPGLFQILAVMVFIAGIIHGVYVLFNLPPAFDETKYTDIWALAVSRQVQFARQESMTFGVVEITLAVALGLGMYLIGSIATLMLDVWRDRFNQ